MWKYVDDKYGTETFTVKSVKEFEAMCADAEFYIELTWRTDGDRDYYVDQHGDVVLEQV